MPTKLKLATQSKGVMFVYPIIGEIRVLKPLGRLIQEDILPFADNTDYKYHQFSHNPATKFAEFALKRSTL